MKKHQIKAKPGPVNILKALSKLKEVVKKPITIPKEFRLTQPKKSGRTTDRYHCVGNKKYNSKTAGPIARSTFLLHVDKPNVSMVTILKRLMGSRIE